MAPSRRSVVTTPFSEPEGDAVFGLAAAGGHWARPLRIYRATLSSSPPEPAGKPLKCGKSSTSARRHGAPGFPTAATGHGLTHRASSALGPDERVEIGVVIGNVFVDGPHESTACSPLHSTAGATRNGSPQCKPTQGIGDTQLIDTHPGVEHRPEHSTRAARRTIGLNGRALVRTVRAENAAVARLRTQHDLAVTALVEPLAGIGGHRLRLHMAAGRARERRLQDDLGHVTEPVSPPTDIPRRPSPESRRRAMSWPDRTRRPRAWS
jgi:hypothetical protein